MVDAQRLRMLTAMGIDVYTLRAPHAAKENVSVSKARLAIVCPGDLRRDERLAPLFAQLPRALGISASAIDWIETDNATAPSLWPCACLVIGAPTHNVYLSTMRQNATTIATIAEPLQRRVDAQAKRELWQTLKPLARRLRTQS